MKKNNIIPTVLLLVLAAMNFLGGIFIGFRYMFVGGIVDIITACKMDSPDAWLIAWGLVKMWLTTIPVAIGYVIAFFLSYLAFNKK